MLKEEKSEMCGNVFSKLSDDLILNIFFKLVDDPRNWARLACVSTKFSSLARNDCCKTKCNQTIPSVVSDLLSLSTSSSAAPPGGWASLYKLAVCCPGLIHSGVLLENSDFGLERVLGPDENYESIFGRVDMPGKLASSRKVDGHPETAITDSDRVQPSSSCRDGNSESTVTGSNCCWSLFDDLLFDTMYNHSESPPDGQVQPDVADRAAEGVVVRAGCDFAVCKRRKISRLFKPHLASGIWNLSGEQGNKLLASRFKGDCLYICNWPGCIHVEERRNYMIFRGIFKNFKQSRVWRTINDAHRPKVDVNCAFCAANHTWDLHSAFCLRRYFGYHDDGEPVVRAYVCENGHVSGAWTDWPLYT